MSQQRDETNRPITEILEELSREQVFLDDLVRICGTELAEGVSSDSDDDTRGTRNPTEEAAVESGQRDGISARTHRGSYTLDPYSDQVWFMFLTRGYLAAGTPHTVRKALTRKCKNFEVHVRGELTEIYRKRSAGPMLVLPPSRRMSFLRSLHEENNHLRAEPLRRAARRIYWFPQVQQLAGLTVRNCEVCNRARGLPTAKVRLWQAIPNAVWGRLHMDVFFIDQVAVNLTVDSFSKFVVLDHIKNVSASETVQVVRNLFARFGPPVELVTDHGTNYTAEVFQNLLEEWGVVHVRGAPGRPLANGLAEKKNREVKERVREIIQEGNKEWVPRLQEIAYTINATRTRTTNSAPCQLMFNRDFRYRLSNEEILEWRRTRDAWRLAEKEILDDFLESHHKHWSRFSAELREQWARRSGEAKIRLSCSRVQMQLKHFLSQPTNDKEAFVKIGDIVYWQGFPYSREIRASSEPRAKGPYMVQDIDEGLLALGHSATNSESWKWTLPSFCFKQDFETGKWLPVRGVENFGKDPRIRDLDSPQGWEPDGFLGTGDLTLTEALSEINDENDPWWPEAISGDMAEFSPNFDADEISDRMEFQETQPLDFFEIGVTNNLIPSVGCGEKRQLSPSRGSIPKSKLPRATLLESARTSQQHPVEGATSGHGDAQTRKMGKSLLRFGDEHVLEEKEDQSDEGNRESENQMNLTLMAKRNNGFEMDIDFYDVSPGDEISGETGLRATTRTDADKKTLRERSAALEKSPPRRETAKSAEFVPLSRKYSAPQLERNQEMSATRSESGRGSEEETQVRRIFQELVQVLRRSAATNLAGSIEDLKESVTKHIRQWEERSSIQQRNLDAYASFLTEEVAHMAEFMLQRGHPEGEAPRLELVTVPPAPEPLDERNWVNVFEDPRKRRRLPRGVYMESDQEEMLTFKEQALHTLREHITSQGALVMTEGVSYPRRVLRFKKLSQAANEYFPTYYRLLDAAECCWGVPVDEGNKWKLTDPEQGETLFSHVQRRTGPPTEKVYGSCGLPILTPKEMAGVTYGGYCSICQRDDKLSPYVLCSQGHTVCQPLTSHTGKSSRKPKSCIVHLFILYTLMRVTTRNNAPSISWKGVQRRSILELFRERERKPWEYYFPQEMELNSVQCKNMLKILFQGRCPLCEIAAYGILTFPTRPSLPKQKTKTAQQSAAACYNWTTEIYPCLKLIPEIAMMTFNHTDDEGKDIKVTEADFNKRFVELWPQYNKRFKEKDQYQPPGMESGKILRSVGYSEDHEFVLKPFPAEEVADAKEEDFLYPDIYSLDAMPRLLADGAIAHIDVQLTAETATKLQTPYGLLEVYGGAPPEDDYAGDMSIFVTPQSTPTASETKSSSSEHSTEKNQGEDEANPIDVE